MLCFFDGDWIPQSEVNIGINDRGFLYGDGVFETIRLYEGRPLHLPSHLDRLTSGLSTLYLTPIITLQELETLIPELAKAEEARHQTVKIFVWRKPGGKYAPHETNAHVLVSCVPTTPPTLRSTDLFDVVTTGKSGIDPTSSFKTMSSLPYVTAGLEKNRQKLDEVVLLNVNGFLMEGLASNLWWIKDDQLYTPSLETGCINGVLRRVILNSVECLQVNENKGALATASIVFTTNVNGLTVLGSKGSPDTSPLVHHIWTSYYPPA